MLSLSFDEWLISLSTISSRFIHVAFIACVRISFFFKLNNIHVCVGFSGGTMVKNPPASSGDAGDRVSMHESGGSPGEGSGKLFLYSCLENSMDREAWQAVQGATKSRHAWVIEHICVYHILFIRSSFSGHLGCFWQCEQHCYARGGTNLSLWDCAFNSFGYKIRSVIARSYGNPIFIFFKEFLYHFPW